VIIETVFGHAFETDIIRHITVKFKAFSLITSALLHITSQVHNCVNLDVIMCTYTFFSCICHTECHTCALVCYDTQDIIS
jgi:hypothetical protein